MHLHLIEYTFVQFQVSNQPLKSEGMPVVLSIINLQDMTQQIHKKIINCPLKLIIVICLKNITLLFYLLGNGECFFYRKHYACKEKKAAACICSLYIA